RAVEAAKAAISSPLLETSFTGAQGELMNITGGSDLSLFEVQEAASIVASASDDELNMIFGSVINENLNDQILVTVIATRFKEQKISADKPAPVKNVETYDAHRELQQDHRDEYPQRDRFRTQPSSESLDIPAFLRNRRQR